MKSFLIFIVPILILSCLFQNCTPLTFKSSNIFESIKSSGNGENYDGKVFVHVDIDHPCSDHKANSVITLTDKGYQLVKKDCIVVVPPLNIDSTLVQTDATYPGIIVYQENKYIFDASTIQTPPDLNCVAKNIGPVDSVKLFLVTGANGPMLVGVADVYGSALNLAFDNTVVDTSSTSTLSGGDQEGSLYLNLFEFDPLAQHPDNTNTKYQYSKGGLGTTGYLQCLRPGGTL
ncbi:MAG: hypothetical protein ACXVCY_16895 [Pseudobdellovibrionaceae bacterium]